MAVLGLRFCARAFSSCGKQGPLFITVCGPLLLRSTGSRRAGSVIVAHGPSCSTACGILPDQDSNPCPLHWQADSQPLRHQGSPENSVLKPRSGYQLCSLLLGVIASIQDFSTKLVNIYICMLLHAYTRIYFVTHPSVYTLKTMSLYQYQSNTTAFLLPY